MSKTFAASEGRRATVTADDGVPIAVRTFGAHDATLTVVFVHGHCLHTESWAILREQLLRHWDAGTRMVFYDHRGHGESGHAHHATYTIDQLAADLDAVLRAVAPTGPVVLVGHSMGAMVLLAYARLFPAAIGERIAGIGLIAGAAGGITEVGLGRLLNRHAVASLQRAVVHAPRVMQASKRFSRWIFGPLIREASAGTRRVNPRVAAIATAILNETPLLTMSGFLSSLLTFDEAHTLPRLSGLPTLVLAGSADLMVPFTHSVVLASQLAGAELVRIEGAGHSVILECAEEVAHSIAALVERAAAGVRKHYAVAG
ncbi:alpha/beta fold hydrolase [Nocardia rhizosphaerihabitans]|uniref:Alpha/beta hydrolase n=1 Tax=Nocardia rhizosphaerihabitans TaxID=1691570 RepID=A0ABQ2KNU2_9NOCA|nr:alpha/beta hydrolase [Nocardia rhizosphaerihabitans]GGN87860.1 alpha/beta hydrolase [Nocardia rhizosphaerihabitans]